MRKEFSQIFRKSRKLQPEQPKPEAIHLPKSPEKPKEEKVVFLAKDLLSLTAIKANGLTEEITKKNFPNIPDDHLEDARFIADTNKHNFLMLNAKIAQDSDLQKMFQKKAAEVASRRDKRMKEFLIRTEGELPAEPTPVVSLVKEKKEVIIDIPSQKKNKSVSSGPYM